MNTKNVYFRASVLGQQYFREKNSTILPEMLKQYFRPVRPQPENITRPEDKTEMIIEVKESKEVPILSKPSQEPENLSSEGFFEFLRPFMPILYSQYMNQFGNKERGIVRPLSFDVLGKSDYFAPDPESLKRKPADSLNPEGKKAMKSSVEEEGDKEAG